MSVFIIVPRKQLAIKVVIAPVVLLSLSVGWVKLLNGDLRPFHLTLNFL